MRNKVTTDTVPSARPSEDLAGCTCWTDFFLRNLNNAQNPGKALRPQLKTRFVLLRCTRRRYGWSISSRAQSAAIAASNPASYEPVDLIRPRCSAQPSAAAAAARPQARRTLSEASITVEFPGAYTAHLGDEPAATAETNKTELLEYFKTMYTMRRMEITCDNEYKARTIRGFCHLYDGQRRSARACRRRSRRRTRGSPRIDATAPL